jgi:hypothetical protein
MVTANCTAAIFVHLGTITVHSFDRLPSSVDSNNVLPCGIMKMFRLCRTTSCNRHLRVSGLLQPPCDWKMEIAFRIVMVDDLGLHSRTGLARKVEVYHEWENPS